MAVFHTSDTHFGHRNIIKYCDRPFRDYEHMDEVMVNNWNETVGPEDTVIHHGDVALGDWQRWNEIFTSLNGHKILVTGNHDRIFLGNKQNQINKFIPMYEEWFEQIHDNMRGFWLQDGSLVNLSHFPYDGDSHDGDRYEEYRLVDHGIILIHGHTHSTEKVTRSKRYTLQIHVGVDAWDFRPVPQTEIIALINEHLGDN